MDITVDVILLGAGNSRRFSPLPQAVPKPFCLLNEEPVFVHCIRSLESLGFVRRIVLVAPKQFLELAKRLVNDYVPNRIRDRIHVIEGGETRQQSSLIALDFLASDAPTRVVIHDACRPFLSGDFLDRIRQTIIDRSYAAWVPVISVVETLKTVENQKILQTLDRDSVRRVQTPQILEFEVIHSLVSKSRENTELVFTDDVSVCEYYGIPVGSFLGDERNIKITYDFDMETLKHILKSEGVNPAWGKYDLESDLISTD